MDAEAIVLEPRQMRCRRLRRTITQAAKLHEMRADYDSQGLGRSAYRKTFITLTYRHRGEWERCHVSRFIRLMRQWFQRRGAACRFVWVAELQKRGALHYHVVVWVPRRLRLPRPDVCGWWPHGSSKIETARNPIGYMVKYATKTRPEDLKRLPKGVRLHGNGGHDDSARIALRETLLPGWARDQAFVSRFLAASAMRNALIESGDYDPDDDACDAITAPAVLRCSGGLVDLRTGEYVPTPWCVEFRHGVLTLSKKPEYLA
ncbi:rolling circle replication-associated protein [Frateuria defendens]|uniref:rolling circle replication-associated protein n=1 Tax=Frateuria defendens TaxID=2219559 RepID=UPI00066FFBA6|nr:hypothetical protein [Frateuria defendens]